MHFSLRPLLTSTAAAALVLAAPRARADEATISPQQMQAEARAYYDAEMKTSFLFAGYGAVTGGAGAASLTQDGDFSKGFGWSSVALGGLTLVGAAGYAIAVKGRGDYYTGLAKTDIVRFQQEEADHIGGTHRRFVLYLATEIAETALGIGLAAYGFAAKNDLVKGIGAGAAIQGIGLFVIDVPGAGRAATYHEDVQRFRPNVGLSLGGANGAPWGATLGSKF